MSAYRVIQTEFRTMSSLIKALADIGYNDRQLEVGRNDNDLQLYDYKGHLRPETCAVRIDRKYVGRISNDVGFAWNSETKTYRAIISDYDQQVGWNGKTMGKLKQQYAFHELSRQAKAKGYTVQQEQTPAGTIRLKLIKR